MVTIHKNSVLLSPFLGLKDIAPGQFLHLSVSVCPSIHPSILYHPSVHLFVGPPPIYVVIYVPPPPPPPPPTTTTTTTPTTPTTTTTPTTPHPHPHPKPPHPHPHHTPPPPPHTTHTPHNYLGFNWGGGAWDSPCPSVRPRSPLWIPSIFVTHDH